MTYLPPISPSAAAALAGPDGLSITQNGLPRLPTLADFAAFVTGATTTGDAKETLTVITPDSQMAGAAFVLRGGYTVLPPAALDYSLDGAAT